RVVAAAASREQEQSTAEHVYGQRMLRHTSRADGSGVIAMPAPLDRTATVMAALEPFERAIFGDNRRAGHAEHGDAVAFDALVQLASASTKSGPKAKRGARPLATLHLHVSQGALERGYTTAGEVCEIE